MEKWLTAFKYAAEDFMEEHELAAVFLGSFVLLLAIALFFVPIFNIIYALFWAGCLVAYIVRVIKKLVRNTKNYYDKMNK